ncbi:kelch repeat-containing protein At3g27220-like isoform X3 [Citrus sinensis]|uniref:kelch repeat-containing protein At3g27220-like isoform X3 n=1 Tax=Citrus sinensis TaxID=2711 RepID=UPI000D6312DD|nr:kelch repeat-containing protein At3g27220-like isoform X3 [Citrus sinensis]
MARFDHHKQHTYTKTGCWFLCVLGLLGAALIADFMWASSSSSFSSSSAHLSVASNWALEKSGVVVIPHVNATKIDRQRKSVAVIDKKGQDAERFLSATFADLPAPDLEWEQMPSAPVPRLDGAAIQIKNLFYVFAGYGSLDYVHSHVDVYNFTDNKWVDRFDMPKDMAHSHLGVVSDGRYIYIVSGQYGPQCRGPTSRTFVLDSETRKWDSMPPLPSPRYSPATQLWRGRLHVMGGSKENRHTPGLEHWSIAVKDGKALEKAWRTEIPIPRGGPHRACFVFNDRLFVVGGQEGDFMAKPGSPIFKCSRRHEVVYGDVYMLDDEMKWKVLPPMPKPNSHIECAWVIVNNSIIITGGTTEKHPMTKRMILVGEVFQFHLDSLILGFTCELMSSVRRKQGDNFGHGQLSESFLTV